MDDESNMLAATGRAMGRKGKGGGSSSSFQEAPNTRQSNAIVKIVDILCEGPIVGLVDGSKSIYLDNTPLQAADGPYNFQGVQWELRVGNPDQDPVSGFPAAETTVDVSTTVASGAPVVRTFTNPDATAARIIMRSPALYAQASDKAQMNGSDLHYTIEVRDSGGTWQTACDIQYNGEKWTSQYEREHLIALPASATGTWDIRVTKITADSHSSLVQNTLVWGSYGEIIQNAFTYPNTAYIAISFNAQLFGTSLPTRTYEIDALIVRVPANYDPVARTYATSGTGTQNGTWDGATWKLAHTDNPAWIVLDLLENPRYGLGLSDDVVSTTKYDLYAIAQYCDEMVDDGFGGQEPRYTCNLCVTTQDDAYKVVQQFVSMFRGMSYWAVGSVAVSADMPAAPTRLVAPANVIDGEMNYEGTSAKSRHTVARVTFINPDLNWTQDIEPVIDDAGVALYGERSIDVVAFGCTSRGLAHRLGKWLLDSEKTQTETLTYKAGLDQYDNRPGDIIAVADPSYAGARMGGRVAYADASTIMLDADIQPDSGQSYKISVTLPDGTVALDQPISHFLSPQAYTGRSTIGTYLDTDGLIHTAAAGVLRPNVDPATLAQSGWLDELAATNLLAYSTPERWGKGLLTVSIVGPSPDGGTNAAALVPTTTSGTPHNYVLAQSASGQATCSIWLKAAGYNFAFIRTEQAGWSTGAWACVDLVNGTVTGSGGSLPATITRYPNGWFRCAITGIMAGSGFAYFAVYPVPSAVSAPLTFTGDGTSGIWAWGAQVELGAAASTLIQTSGTVLTRAADALYYFECGRLTNGTYLGRDGLLHTAGPNIIRPAVDPTTLAQTGWLDEASATNLMARAYFDTNYGRNNCTVPRVTGGAPDGTSDAFAITPNAISTSTFGVYSPPASVPYGQAVTISVYAKANGYSQFCMSNGQGFSTATAARFDLIAGAVVSQTANANAAITPVGNGWFRCSLNAVCGLSGVHQNVFAVGSPTGTSANAIFDTNWTPDGVSSILLFGPQFETGSAPSSYIYTDGSHTATRDADKLNLFKSVFTTAVLASPLAQVPDANAMWLVTSAALAPRQFRIVGVTEPQPGQVQVSALFHDPAKYARVEQGIYLAEPPYSILPRLNDPLPAPSNVDARDYMAGVGTTTVIRVTVSWSPPRDPRVQSYQVRATGDTGHYSVRAASGNSIDIDGLPPGNYVFSVRSYNTATGASSAWADSVTVNVDGLSDPPGPPTALTAVGGTRRVQLTWQASPARDTLYYEVWRGSTASGGPGLGATMIAHAGGTSYTDADSGVLLPNTTMFYWVRAVSTTLVASGYAGPASATTTLLVADDIADGILSTAKFAASIKPVTLIDNLSAPGVVNDIALNKADGKLYTYGTSGWALTIATVSAPDIIGQLTSDQITALAATKVSGQLTDAQLASISAAKVLGALTNATIAAPVITGLLSDTQIAALAATKITGTLTDSQISALAATKITGTLTSAQIASLDGAKITNAITTATIGAAKITGQLTSAQISSLDAAKLTGTMAAGQQVSMDASLIAGSILDAQIAGLSASKVAGALSSATIAAPSITGTLSDAQIAALAATKITGTLTNAQIASLAATKITGTLTDAQIAALDGSKITNAITTATLPAASVTGQLTDSQIAALDAAKLTGTILSTQAITMDASRISGSILDAQIAGLSASKVAGALTAATIAAPSVTGTLADSQIAALAATKITGTLSNTQIASLAATKITGTLSDAQIAALSATKITGTLADSQIAALAATKITGTLSDSQIAALSGSKVTGSITAATLPAGSVTGTLTDSQLAAISAAKITGQLTDSQIAALAAAKLTGQITTTQITDGGITTPKLAAGAVTASTIAANTITSAQLSVGSGTNVIWNPCCPNDASGWATAFAGGVTGLSLAANTDANWEIAGVGSGALTFTSSTSGTGYAEAGWKPAGQRVPVTPGTYVVAQVALIPVNIAARLVLRFYDASGAGAGSIVGPVIRPSAATDGKTLANYTRAWITMQAGATAASVLFTIAADNDGGADITSASPSAVYFTQAGLGFSANPVAECPPWSPGGVTEITGGVIKTGSITAANIAAGTITSNEIAASTITGADIAAGTITSGNIAANTITAGNIAAATITSAQLAANSVTASQIAANAVTTAALAAGAVTAVKITSGTITSTQIAASTITGANIAGATITAANLVAGTITATQLAANSVTTTQLAAGAVTAAKITAGTITSNELAASSVTTAQLAAGAVTAPKITAGTITSNEIAASTITAANIAAATITGAKIAAGTITGSNIAATTITAGNIAAGTITATQLAANSVTSSQIAAGAVVAGKIAAGTVTATEIAAATITSAKLAIANPNNLIWNSCCPNSVDGWTGAAGISGATLTASTDANWRLAPFGSGVFSGASLPSTSTIGYFDWSPTAPVPVTAGYYYAFQALLLPVNICADLTLLYYDASGTLLGQYWATKVRPNSPADGKTPDRYQLAWTAAQAPAGAVQARVRVRAYNDLGAGMTAGSPFALYFTQAALTVSPNPINECPPWTPGGVTEITGGVIRANSITATQIAAGTITTTQIAAATIIGGDIAAGTITGSNIAAATIAAANLIAGTITANEIAGATITGAKIAAATITGANLVAGTITATQLGASSVTTSALAAGAVTAAKITAGTITTNEIAASTITAANIAAATITGAKIAAGTITGSNIAATTITAGNIAAGTITATQLAANSVTSSQLAAGSVIAGKIAAGTITATEIAANTITSAQLTVGNPSNVIWNPCCPNDASGWFRNYTSGGFTGIGLDASSDPNWTLAGFGSGAFSCATAASGSLAEVSWKPGGAFVPVVPGAYVVGQIAVLPVNIAVRMYLRFNDATGATIGGAYTTAWLRPSTATDGKTLAQYQVLWKAALAPAGAATVQLAIQMENDGGADITGTNASAVYFTQAALGFSVNPVTECPVWSPGGVTQIEGGVIKSNSIVTRNLAAGAVTANEIAANTITAGNIASATITGGNIAAGTITAANLVAGTITSNEIAAATITAANIAAATITGAKLVSGTITATQLAASSVTTTQLAAGAVTAAKITSGTITSTQIAANTITAGNIAAATITGAKIAAGTITGSNIAASTITASNIAAGTITATQLAANSITSGKIAAGAISAGSFAAGAITSGDIAANAITATHLSAGSVTATALAAGSVTTSALAVGSASNVIWNSSCIINTDGWSTYGNASGVGISANNAGGYVTGVGAGWVTATTCASGQFFEAFWTPNNIYGMACSPGDWIEAQALLSAYACAGYVKLEFKNSAGSVLAVYTGNRVVGGGGTAISGYTRSWIAAQAPANAATCSILIYGTNDGGADITGTAGSGCIVGFCRAQLGFTVSNPSQPAAFTPGGVTSIPGGQIITGTLTAAQIAAGSLTGDRLAANTITGDKIAANTITAGVIAAGAIGSSEIAAGAITATQLASSTLITMSGQIGNLVVTNAQIANLTIGSGQINYGSATYVGLGSATGSHSTAANTTESVQVMSAGVYADVSTLVIGGAIFHFTTDLYSTDVTVRLRINDTDVWSQYFAAPGIGHLDVTVNPFVGMSVGSGWSTVYLFVDIHTTSADTVHFNTANITGVAFNR